jgi:DNA repair protein RadD
VLETMPFQDRTLDAMEAAKAGGARRVLISGPTGCGKSLMMRERIRRIDGSSILYTNRRMLREQLSEGMEAEGIRHGVRASGVAPALLRDVQVSSIQTEAVRVYKQKKWELHKADEVHVDEAHVQKTGVAERILTDHFEDGATIFGWTATPVDLGEMYDHLIIAATNSELRECGLHVPCQTYGPDEPDLRKIGPVKVGEDLSEEQNKQAIMRPGIFGRVFDWWKRLNPDAKPAILFAPGVPESLWFAEQFHAQGVPAAHIDGEDIWINGERMPSTPEARRQLADASSSGDVAVVCNRFVMREGIDWPWLYHCIMATVFGSVQSYLQAGGRLLRAHSSLDHVVLQDHGGNWHRHGSLNADREWRLEYTAAMVAGMRAERMREKREAEPIVCSACGKIRAGGARCSCGFAAERRSRSVIQHDGTLKSVEGEIYKARRIKQLPDTEEKWRSMYYRAKNSKQGMTFNQARGLFFYENHYYPPNTLPYMPTRETDWFRKVKSVNASDLTRKEAQ